MRPMRARTISRLWLWRGAGAALALALCLLAIPIALGADSAPARLVTPGNSRLERDPEAPFRYVTAGWLDWAAAQFGESALRRDDAEAWLLAGLALESSGDWAGALEAYERGALAAKDERSAGAAWTLLGNLRLQQEEFGAAREAFEKALELNPQSAQAMYGLGRIDEQAGKAEEAIAWYRQATEAAKEWIEPVVAQAALLIDGGVFVEALVLLRGAEALGTWHAAYHYQLARGYGGLLQRIRAEGISDEVAAALAELNIEEGQATAVLKERALHAADRARQLSAGFPDAESLVSRLEAL